MITTIDEAREMVRRGIERVGAIKGRVSSVEFRTRLNRAFEPEQVTFIKLNVPKKEYDFYGGSCDTISKVIEIYLNKHHIHSIMKLYKKNLDLFEEEIFTIVIHELKHRHQFNSNMKHKIVGEIIPEGMGYYKDHYEIDAYAQDVAYWLGKTEHAMDILDIYKIFRKEDPKTHKRFMKKVYKYMVSLNMLED